MSLTKFHSILKMTKCLATQLVWNETNGVFCGRKEVGAASQSVVSKFEMRQVALFNDHNSQVWRLSWNVTGTILCSSGDDGFVRLWKG